MVVNGDVQPMELAHLPYKKGRTYEDYVGSEKASSAWAFANWRNRSAPSR